MLNSRIVSLALASSLVLGSAGVALASTHGNSPNNYYTFLAGDHGTPITDPSAKVPTYAPFAIDGSGPAAPVNPAVVPTPEEAAQAKVNPDPFH